MQTYHTHHTSSYTTLIRIAPKPSNTPSNTATQITTITPPTLREILRVPVGLQVITISELNKLPIAEQWETTIRASRGLGKEVKGYKVALIHERVRYAKSERDKWVAAGCMADVIDEAISEFEAEAKRLSQNPEEMRRASGIRQLKTWLNDARGQQIFREISPSLECSPGTGNRISNDGVKHIRRLVEVASNTSWEVSEMINWIKLNRWLTGDLRNEWTATDSHVAQLYISGYVEAKKTNGSLDMPFKLIRESSVIRQLPGLTYTPAGFLYIESSSTATSVPAWPAPPTFPGEEHLEVIRHYEEGGDFNTREKDVGEIEKKAKTRVLHGSKPCSNARARPYMPIETGRMRRVQALEYNLSVPYPEVDGLGRGEDDGINNKRPTPTHQQTTPTPTHQQATPTHQQHTAPTHQQITPTPTRQQIAPTPTRQRITPTRQATLDRYGMGTHCRTKAARIVASRAFRQSLLEAWLVKKRENSNKTKGLLGIGLKLRSLACWGIKAWKRRLCGYFGAKKPRGNRKGRERGQMKIKGY